MSEENWLPVQVKKVSRDCFIAVFRNENDEEFLHEIHTNYNLKGVPDISDSSWGFDDCWDKCNGDRPGCKQSCPIYSIPVCTDDVDYIQRILWKKRYTY